MLGAAATPSLISTPKVATAVHALPTWWIRELPTQYSSSPSFFLSARPAQARLWTLHCDPLNPSLRVAAPEFGGIALWGFFARHTEFALTGCDGVIGIASFLGGESTPFWAEALSAGFAYRLAGRLVARELAQTSSLARILLRYVHALMVEIGQIAVCNRHHTLEERLCRWLLSSLDRLNSAELAVTHELISHVLGVRREGVTQALGSLKNAGLIHQARGRIVQLDRPRLEARVCECYAIVRREHDARLIPETSWYEHASARPGTGPVRLKRLAF